VCGVINEDHVSKSNIMKNEYTTEDLALEAKLSNAANEEGTIQAGDMLQFTSEPTRHTTTSVKSAFEFLTGKSYDTDFFCDR
jgi:hypothetical protein